MKLSATESSTPLAGSPTTAQVNERPRYHLTKQTYTERQAQEQNEIADHSGQNISCFHCRLGEESVDKWVMCEICHKWEHVKCVGLGLPGKLPDDELAELKYQCRACTPDLWNHERRYMPGIRPERYVGIRMRDRQVIVRDSYGRLIRAGRQQPGANQQIGALASYRRAVDLQRARRHAKRQATRGLVGTFQ